MATCAGRGSTGCSDRGDRRMVAKITLGQRIARFVAAPEARGGRNPRCAAAARRGASPAGPSASPSRRATPRAGRSAPRSGRGAGAGSIRCPSPWSPRSAPETAINAASRRSPPTRDCGRSIGRLEQPELPLEPGEGEHPVVAQGCRELLGGESVDLVPAVRDEVEHEPQLPELHGELAHLVVAQPGRIPVERRRQVVGEHLLRDTRSWIASANRRASSRFAVFVSIHSRSANGAAARDLAIA